MLILSAKSYAISFLNFNVPTRNLRSKQLVYSEFGDPLHVVKFRDCEVRPLEPQEVLVRMMAAPVNPVDINIIKGMYSIQTLINKFRYYLPINFSKDLIVMSFPRQHSIGGKVP